MPGIGYGAIAVAVCIAVVLAGRGRWDLLAAHGRDMIRHVLAAVLMLGTLAGTVWTFSAGKLTLAGAAERIVSVGGVAAALECGAIYTGWYIGQLDMRIMTARKREKALEYRALRGNLIKWFYAVVGTSAAANLIFRTQQLGNLPLAAFVSVAPIILIILFTIKLRPLPVDYAEVGRQATQRGLVTIVQTAQHALIRDLKRMGRGERLNADEIAQLRFAAALVRVYAPTDEQHALDHAIGQGTGSANVIEATAERWLTTAEVATEYHISRRRAQEWVAACPGRRKAARGHTWEVPASAMYAAHGVPSLSPADSSTQLLMGADESAEARESARKRGASAERRGESATGRDASAGEGALGAAETVNSDAPALTYATHTGTLAEPADGSLSEL